MKILGLSGYARSGKDTFASYLAEHGWERRAFADKLREFLYAQNPIVATDYGHISLALLVDAVGWEAAKEQNPENTYSPRQVLQRLGTEAGRKILGENVWVDAAVSSLEQGGYYVFTDVRFPNEAQAIVDRGGHMIRVERNGYDAINAHPSETALDDWEFNGYVFNNGSLADLREIARSFA